MATRTSARPLLHLAIDERSTQGGMVEIWSARPIPLQQDDIVVLFRRTAGVEFYAWARVGAPDVRGDKADRDGGYAFRAPISVPTSFDTPARLGDFAFSLECVTNTQEPWRHFRRSHRYISEADYRVLRYGEVFWARTAIGIFLGRLPARSQARMIARLLMDDPGSANDLGRAWLGLQRRLETMVVLATVSRHVAARMDSLSNSGVETLEAVRWRHPDAEQSFDLKGARAMFARVANAFGGTNGETALLEAITHEVRAEIADGFGFRRAEGFAGRLWPVSPVA